MKNLLYLFLLVGIFACSSKDEPKSFQIKATDKISIKQSTSAINAPLKVKSLYTHLSAIEIVKQTTEISFIRNGIKYMRSFTNEQRDTVSVTPKLLMWATDVISLDGNLQPDFIEATDVVLVHYNPLNYQGRDTIACIRNSTLRLGESAIRLAFNAKDITACYSVFDDTYKFEPITGAEWRALKAQNLQ